MSNFLTENENINNFQENNLPKTKEELINIEKAQIEIQNNLKEKIKVIEEKLNLEKNNSGKFLFLKEQELNKKNQELQIMKNNNQRLRINLHKLQVETNKRLDRIEMKEKNELYEKEKEKKQSSLDQLL